MFIGEGVVCKHRKKTGLPDSAISNYNNLDVLPIKKMKQYAL